MLLAIGKLLLAFHCDHVFILYCFWAIQRRLMACPWYLGLSHIVDLCKWNSYCPTISPNIYPFCPLIWIYMRTYSNWQHLLNFNNSVQFIMKFANFFLKQIAYNYMTSQTKHRLTVSNCYVIVTFYVPNVHCWPIRKSAVACRSLSLQRYQWIAAIRYDTLVCRPI